MLPLLFHIHFVWLVSHNHNLSVLLVQGAKELLHQNLKFEWPEI
jgi:hypothetical protein